MGRMRFRVIGVCAATVLAAGLLSALPVAAGAQRAAAQRAAFPTPVLSPRSLPRLWKATRRASHASRSTRRAPFLSWSQQKSLSTASIVHSYKVTTTADTTPASCPATTTEPCTLRQAVNQVNADGTLDKIQLPAATSPYLLESDQLVVTDPAGVVISGKGQTKTVVEADMASPTYPFRVLQINGGSNVQISNITIEDGTASTSTEDGDGGGIEVLLGSLTMRNSTFRFNAAYNDGGAIYVAGQNSIGGTSGGESQAYLKNVTINGNTSTYGGGGLDVEGQAIIGGGLVTRNVNVGTPEQGAGIRLGDDGQFYPSLSANDLTVTANSNAGEGGGIYNAGSLDLSEGAIGGPTKADGNSSTDPGGGLYNSQVATLHNVAVQHNSAEYGGGIENADRVSVIGGSLSANRAQDAAGLDNEQAQANLKRVKVSGNRAADEAGGLANVGSNASLSVSGGSITGNTAPNNGGGIFTAEPATVEGTSVRGNAATSGFGGGIYSDAPLTLTRVQLGTSAHPNVAEEGGGLYTEHTGATIVRSTIEGNRARSAGAGSGGGIYATSGAVDELHQTTVAGNSSDSEGGGITNSGATVAILTSTISGNQARGSTGVNGGGGIANTPDPESGETATLKMVNDTVTGNRAGSGTQSGYGGGLFNDPGASATLTNVTVSRNRASTAGGGIASDGTAALRGTLLAANTAAGAPANCDVPAPLQSDGYNLDNDGTCGLHGIGDQTGVSPKLGPLANNGGPTQTMALLAGSPAIDAVQFCPPPKTDQRGVKRQGPCDIGAYERVPDR